MAKNIEQMTMVEVARALADLGQTDKALEAYTTALKQTNVADEERLEAACAVLQYGEDYKPAYDAFLALYREGALREDVLSILTEAFYLPNVKKQKKQYQKNCKLLQNYPYLFRKDFPDFEALPIQFYPYDTNGVLPFYKKEERFCEYFNGNDSVIAHYFFKDLTNPILAHDIFSQYELEYLRDNVRRSDWAGRENHIYLHYSNWEVFCSYLQYINLAPVLVEEKVVFLIEDEESLYPIDFKERFGIDYSQYPVRPFSVREVNKLIWHTQLGYHNGGDFFNEIMDGHPYLLADTSRYLDEQTRLCKELIAKIKDTNRDGTRKEYAIDGIALNRNVSTELFNLKHISLKDAFVGYFLMSAERYNALDHTSRIAPALLFQPHFNNMEIYWKPEKDGGAIVNVSGYEDVKKSPLFKDFKYIKTFTPVRRPTTSLAATVRFVDRQVDVYEANSLAHKNGTLEASDEDFRKTLIIGDCLSEFIMNRNFMVDEEHRLFRDSRLVRFEDGKLNPTATFTALAEFLDIPYTESMKHCTGVDEEAARRGGWQTVGFDLRSVYRTYDEFADKNERTLLEYCLRDLYQLCGYDFHYYNGTPITREQLDQILEESETILKRVERSFRVSRDAIGLHDDIPEEQLDAWLQQTIDENIGNYREKRQLAVYLSAYQLLFFSPQGKKLRLMTPLQLDPALLETELYH